MFFLFPDRRQNQPHARKVFKIEDGAWTTKQIPMAGIWKFAESDAENLEALYIDLKRVAEHGGVMIHGSVTEPVGRSIRRVSCGENATISNTPLSWVAMDVDTCDITPPGCDTPEAAREWWTESSAEEVDAWYHQTLYPALALPEIFAGVRPILHLSSSAFIKSATFRGHLFFRLDRPVVARYWKHVLKSANGIDVSKYSAEHILYLQNPMWLDESGNETRNPWSGCGPHYSWRLVRTGSDQACVTEDAVEWQPPVVAAIAYVPCEALPAWRNNRWWIHSGIESDAKQTAMGDRHETMRKQAVRIARAITSRECDETIWSRYMAVWLARDKPQSEIENLISWACRL